LMLTPFHLGSLGGKREKDDHFTLDVVTNSQEQKCGLKYVELNRFAVVYWGSI